MLKIIVGVTLVLVVLMRFKNIEGDVLIMLAFESTRENTFEEVHEFLSGVRNLVAAQIFDEETIEGLSLDEYYKKISEETGIYIVDYKENAVKGVS